MLKMLTKLLSVQSYFKLIYNCFIRFQEMTEYKKKSKVIPAPVEAKIGSEDEEDEEEEDDEEDE